MTHEFDLTVRNGTVVTASDAIRCDVGVRDGRILAMEVALPAGRRDLDAAGHLVLRAWIAIAMSSSSPRCMMCADDFFSATVAAAFGGTTTIIPFAAQHKGNSLVAVVDDYAKRAAEKAVIDYGFHLIISDPTPHALDVELPGLIARGITSFKVYMTYDLLKLDDGQLLDVLAVADRERALVMVHAENHEMIRWLAKRLLERGHNSPKFHAISHSSLAESEATHRVIQLSRLLDVPVLVVHVSGIDAVKTIRAAQALGARVYGETCPQYLFLTAEDIDKPGLEGAKYCCSPPPRDAASQAAVWDALVDGTLQVFSSDHAPYRFDETGSCQRRQDHLQGYNGVPDWRCAAAAVLGGSAGAASHSTNLSPYRHQPCTHVRSGRSKGHGASAPTLT
jgi:dihydropyrimidinase